MAREKNMVNETLELVKSVINEIGFDRFMKNLRSYEPDFYWKEDVDFIARELHEFNIDPVTFCY